MSDEDKRQIFFSFIIIIFCNFYMQGNAKWTMNTFKKICCG